MVCVAAYNSVFNFQMPHETMKAYPTCIHFKPPPMSVFQKNRDSPPVKSIMQERASRQLGDNQKNSWKHRPAEFHQCTGKAGPSKDGCVPTTTAIYSKLLKKPSICWILSSKTTTKSCVVFFSETIFYCRSFIKLMDSVKLPRKHEIWPSQQRVTVWRNCSRAVGFPWMYVYNQCKYIIIFCTTCLYTVYIVYIHIYILYY